MNLRYLFLIPLLIIGAFFAGKLVIGAPLWIIAIATALAIGLITFQNPENGLLVLVFSMLLSPQIVLVDIPGRPLTVRIDDLLIIVVFVAWLARLSVTKEWKWFTKTELDLPMMLLMCVYVIGTTRGILFGSVNNPLKAFFFTLKYLEYYILYWIAVNIITSKEMVRRYLVAGALTLVIVLVYAYSQFGQPGGVSAPFDWAGKEPASLGGYFLILFAVIFGFLLHVESTGKRLLCLALLLAILPAFVRTLSRASYLSFIPMVLTMFILTKKRKLLLGILLLGGAILFPLLFQSLYSDMVQRIMVTFTGSHEARFSAYQVGDKKITDQSALERIESWQWVVNKRFTKNPFTALIGNGVTGLGFVEGQFFLVLGEAGILGALFFYWLLFSVFRHSCRIYRASTDAVPQSLSLAAAGCLVALVFQSLTTNTFIIVRIMEPFWFLVALVMISRSLYDGQQPPVTA